MTRLRQRMLEDLQRRNAGQTVQLKEDQLTRLRLCQRVLPYRL